MDRAIIEKMAQLSDEERQILQGRERIRRDDYSETDTFIVSSGKLLGGGKQIDFRLHTRFVDFPEHGHDYMEFMYVYAGSVTHVIGGERIELHCGDILFLNRHIRHSILRADSGDLGINFIASNAFLQYVFHNVENNPVMSDFLTRNFHPHGEGEYLLFRTADIFPIRNLMDNLIYAIARRTADDAILTQLVALLFSYLAYYRETLKNSLRLTSPDRSLQRTVADYVDRHYPLAQLAELADKTGYNYIYLSRKIRRMFGKSFQELVQEKRLQVAERLLRTTDLSVEEIVHTVGYENQTHFHALFKERYGTTPHRYRLAHAGEAASAEEALPPE